jgi:hypothetical protein
MGCRFTLVYVLYSTAIATPGHGSLSPLALGFTIYVGVVAGAPLLNAIFCCMHGSLLLLLTAAPAACAPQAAPGPALA